jgi:hypothetical protein
MLVTAMMISTCLGEPYTMHKEKTIFTLMYALYNVYTLDYQIVIGYQINIALEIFQKLINVAYRITVVLESFKKLINMALLASKNMLVRCWQGRDHHLSIIYLHSLT